MSQGFPRRCWVEVDLVALRQNVKRIRARLPANVRYISVVKADAYGLGASRAVGALREAGVDAFAVANITEAAQMREAAHEVPILLLSATTPEEDSWVVGLNLVPTISTPGEARRYQEVASRAGRPVPVHVKIDTGMGRLGIWHERWGELEAALLEAPLLRIEGVYSHFASGGEDAAFTAEQRETFLRVYHGSALLRQCPDLLVHIDNSSGLGSFVPKAPWNAVRVGLLQYGILPAAGTSLASLDLQTALSWHARVSVVKTMPSGATVSYGRTCVLRRESRVAVVTAGYADGIPRACSNRSTLLIGGRRCAILGNITMDEVTVDITDVPEVEPGDVATIIGRQGGEEISIQEFSDSARTIPWETMCGISKRVERLYAESGSRRLSGHGGSSA